MIQSDNWPDNMKYITCEDYTGSNTPERTIDIRSFFIKITEPATYGKFTLANDNMPFNGYSTLNFDMEILSVSIRSGIEYNENYLGSWTAGFASPLRIKSNESMGELKVKKIYRIYTVVVSIFVVLNYLIKIL